MDERSLLTAAEAHVEAIVERDLDAALFHVVPSGREQIGRNLTTVLPFVSAATVDGIQVSKGRDEAIAYLRFIPSDAAERDVLVESHWVEGDGRPLLSYAHRL